MDLYRFYDDTDRLLYIGISLHAAHRASEHRKDKPWWPDVVRMQVERLNCDRPQAEAVEREAIITERPLYNVVHNSQAPNNQPRSRPSTDYRQTLVGFGLRPGDTPLECMTAYAIGLDDGDCPVGLVTKIWSPERTKLDVNPDFSFEVRLYHWLYDEFWGDDRIYKWSNVRSVLRADFHVEDNCRVFEMDPLAIFQTRYVERNSAAVST